MIAQEVAPLVVDSHQHFWRVERGDYHWMDESVRPLLQDFGPADLAPHMARAGVSHTVLVQAAQTEAETYFLLDIAENTDFVAGVVGWLDFDSAEFPARLFAMSSNPWLVGLRPMLQDLSEDDWIMRPRVIGNLKHLATTGLTFDILTLPRHLPYVCKALERVPELRCVPDHLSKPPISMGKLDPWRKSISELASNPKIHCKISGMVTEARANWEQSDFIPYFEHSVEAFGGERLMFGSDWPVANLSSTYSEVVDLAMLLARSRLSTDNFIGFCGRNAANFYELKITSC